jgi:hypothetical protein
MAHELARGSTQDDFDSGGDATPELPPLAWEFTEPADLLDPGWGRLPATASTSLYVSANLIGYNAEKFDGKADCLLDGEPLPFGFSNNMLTATLDGLIVGTHTIFLNAGSGLGVASRALTFEVVDTPPVIQVGISETDGNLVVSFDRPMPASQLGDIARWNPQGFDSDKQNVTVLSGNMSVSIGMSYPLQMDDPKWFDNSDAIPFVEFESTLGISKCPLWSQYDDEGERQGQTLHCDKGDITSEQCHSKLDWTFDWSHVESNDGEERQAINTEDWPPFIVEPWSSCYTYNVVRHSSIGEGHLNYHLAANWGAQSDTVWESGTPYYSGVGYFGWHREVYLRNHSYYPPSWCDWGWELTVDCNNCMGDPPGYESKGFYIDEPIYVDHTPPEIEVEIVCGNEIHNRVNQLISTLSGTGTVYTGSNQTGDNTMLYNYYWTNMGQYIDAWLQLNPDGLCVIIQAEDPQSTEGNYVMQSISMDYETQTEKICVDNLAWNFFYVDQYPLFNSERTAELWPKVGSNGLYMDWNDPKLHTDGYKTGEHSVWISLMDCEYLEKKNLRFRATDEVNNWARSEDLALGDDFDLVITSPPEGMEFDYDAEIEFTAAITGNPMYQFLEENIEWEILTADYQSVVSGDEDWKGPTFTVEHLRDCCLTVKASINVCGNEYYDERNVYDPEIIIDIEPGPYWIDGPSIPITGGEWPFHDMNIREMAILESHGKDAPETQNTCTAPRFTPDPEELELSQVKVRIDPSDCIDFIDIAVINPLGQESLKINHASSDTYVEIPWEWDINGSQCGLHEIIIRGYDDQDPLFAIIEVSNCVELSRVKQGNLLDVAHIYDGDSYLWGGDRCPGHPWPYIYRDKDCDLDLDEDDKEYWDGVIDCSHYVYQCLRRLGRGLSPYDVYYKTCNNWPPWDRVEFIGRLEDLSPSEVRPGDIILWWNSQFTKRTHIGIFQAWSRDGYFTVMDADSEYGCGETEYRITNRHEAFRWADTVQSGNPIFTNCND